MYIQIKCASYYNISKRGGTEKFYAENEILSSNPWLRKAPVTQSFKFGKLMMRSCSHSLTC